MADQPDTHHTFAEAALDHLEQEIEALEGTSRWKRWAGWAFVVLLVGAVIGTFAWFIVSPPPITSAGKSYVPSGGTGIEINEPRGPVLAEAPTRFAWESVSGRLQYIEPVYVKGSGDPVFERVVTATSIELTPDDRARMPAGKTYVGTVVAQAKDGSTLGSGETTFRIR